jgi:hypothetical protein
MYEQPTKASRVTTNTASGNVQASSNLDQRDPEVGVLSGVDGLVLLRKRRILLGILKVTAASSPALARSSSPELYLPLWA